MRYGSDVVVDGLIDLGIEHVALNPGASFRGIHDSLVNRSDAPSIILCPHEKIAINIAHGFAKATGRPMAAIVHDVVGLLHGSLGLFYATTDRCPVIVLGGAGPMDTMRRRPEIDWIHTANVQGNAVRDFVKWDDQPASIAAIPDSLLRAYRLAIGEPAGPVYVAIDADLQEQPTEVRRSIADERITSVGRHGPDPQRLDAAARMLVAAEEPVIVTGYAGRDPAAFTLIPQLATLLGARIIDTGSRLSAPNTHPMNLTGLGVPDTADVVVFLDVKDLLRAVSQTETQTRDSSRLAEGARLIDVGFGDLHASSWVQHQGAPLPVDVQVPSDTAVALPLLLARCQELLGSEAGTQQEAREQRRARIRAAHRQMRSDWEREAVKHADDRPVAPAWLASEVWSVVREHDWVLAAGTLNEWATRVWDFDRAYRHPGKSLGTATQIGMSLGVALAHRGKGRLVVGLQPDGDLLFDPASLWVAATNRLPLLLVMYNNRAYYNDWHHQILMARHRGTPIERAAIGIEIDGPSIDFAQLARSFGWWAEGPVERPGDVRASVERAAQVVASEGRPALVDVVCAHR